MGDGGIPGLPLDTDIQPPTSDGTPIVGPPIQTSTFDIACPDEPTDFPREHFDHYFRDVYCVLHGYGIPDWLSAGVAAISCAPVVGVVILKDVVLATLKVFMPPFARVALSAIGDLRRTLDPEFGALSVEILGELLGTELQADDMPTKGDFQNHIARAERLGAIFHTLLASEFADKTELTVESGVKAAERFSGLVINFGTATGLIGFLGGLFPFGHVNEIREIAEEVARNLGLGRLHRMAMRPLFQTMMATPYQWYLNLKFRPTQFTALELVNPFTGVVMPAGIVHDSLARLGYSDDKIKALVELHQKKLAFADLFRLHSRGALSDEQYKLRTQQQGIPDDQTGFWELTQLWTAEQKWEDEVVSAAADAYKFGNIDRIELEQVAKTFLHDDAQVTLFLMAQDYKRHVPHRSLTLAQVEHLFEVGIFDLSEFDDHLTTMGFSDLDVSALRLDTLLKLNKQAEAAKAKAAAAAAKAAATAAKLAAQPAGTPPTP